MINKSNSIIIYASTKNAHRVSAQRDKIAWVLTDFYLLHTLHTAEEHKENKSSAPFNRQTKVTINLLKQSLAAMK